jgi:UDP-N-acetylmuramoyl-tripeptide--D-alanyl-D-alanine ligase
MKNIFKKIIIIILILEAKLVLIRFKPKIIAVTGSVGKTSAKDAIFSALSGTFKIRKNQKSLNSEIGTPLTILGLENAWNDPMLWFKNIVLGFLKIFSFNYPDWLVLEIGVDRPGDMPKIARWLKPDIVVITALPKIPAHVEFFNSPEEVIKEKISLIRYMNPNGSVILNADDPITLEIKKDLKRKTFTYGSKNQKECDVFFSNDNIIYEDFEGIKLPIGFSFKISNEGNTVPMSLRGVLGIQHAYPIVCAIAVGLSQDVPFLNMTNSLSNHKPPKGRMNIIPGKSNSVIIDDSYNSSPTSVYQAIETLLKIESNGPKFAVLGDMLEIGSFTASEHKKVGEQVANSSINFLVTIGIRAESISEEAKNQGMNEKHILCVKKEEIKEAIEFIESKLKSGSIVLVKGSQGIRTEKIVAGLMQDPSRKKELLVRQETAWENR